jgi:branched-chain amino acid transport system substrate-binding protein
MMAPLKIRAILKTIFLALILCAFSLSLMIQAGAGETRGVTATEIRIGVIPDLTGPASFGSRNHLWSIRKYLDEINGKGGIHGRKIRLYVEDGKYNPSIALNAFKKLILKEKVFAMMANMGSAANKVQLPLIEEYKVPLISPAVTSEWMYNPPKRYIFATMLSQGYCARVLIDYVVNQLGDKKPRIGVLYIKTELGHESLREVKDQADMYGFKIATEIDYTPGSIDLSGQVAKLKEKDVDYVMLSGIIKGPLYACKEAAKLDWKPQFLFPGVASDEHVFALGKETMFYGKLPIGASAYYPVSANFPGKKTMLTWLKEDPKQGRIYTYNLHGLTYVRTLVEGLKRAGKDLTVEGLVRAMETIQDWDNWGQGPITFGPNDRQGADKVSVFRGVKGGADGIGRWEIVKTWTEPKKR